jgi:predicted acetyltransferase
MTSVRPKLKPETPKAVTAWQTATGHTVWMAEDGSWTKDVAQIAAFVGDEAEQRLASAMQQEHVVTDPYFMEVTYDGEITGRETLREKLRAQTIALFAGGQI